MIIEHVVCDRTTETSMLSRVCRVDVIETKHLIVTLQSSFGLLFNFSLNSGTLSKIVLIIMLYFWVTEIQYFYRLKSWSSGVERYHEFCVAPIQSTEVAH